MLAILYPLIHKKLHSLPEPSHTMYRIILLILYMHMKPVRIHHVTILL